jgi:hypothetical protein
MAALDERRIGHSARHFRERARFAPGGRCACHA